MEFVDSQNNIFSLTTSSRTDPLAVIRHNIEVLLKLPNGFLLPLCRSSALNSYLLSLLILSLLRLKPFNIIQYTIKIDINEFVEIFRFTFQFDYLKGDATNWIAFPITSTYVMIMRCSLLTVNIWTRERPWQIEEEFLKAAFEEAKRREWPKRRDCCAND